MRDYLPDDDVRQINWPATARVGRPMSNQYRIEQDRDVVCLLDAGRLMAAPRRRPRITRLDAAVDAVTMVALVADELGDRCGVTVYDAEIRRRLAPRRTGARPSCARSSTSSPTRVDSDHDLAFRAVGGVEARADRRVHRPRRRGRGALAARRGAGARAPARGRDRVGARSRSRRRAATRRPRSPRDVYAAAVALDVLDGRARVIERLRHLGADGDRSAARAPRRGLRPRLPAAQVASPRL